MRDRHAMGGHRHPEIRRGVREAILHEQIEGEVEPLSLGADEGVGRQLDVLQGDVIGNRRGADRADVLRGEPRRAGLDDEARDAGAAPVLAGARPHEAPAGVVSVGDEDLAAVEHPAVAAPLGARLDGAGRVGAARRLGDGEERPPALAHRRLRVLLDLLLGARPDRRWRVAAEHAAAHVVESHPVLRHLLQHDRHAERVEPAAAVLFGRAQRPQAGRLRPGGQPLVVLLGKAGRVGIEPLLERNDLLADEATDLLAQHAQLVRQREAGKHRHGPG